MVFTIWGLLLAPEVCYCGESNFDSGYPLLTQLPFIVVSRFTLSNSNARPWSMVILLLKFWSVATCSFFVILITLLSSFSDIHHGVSATINQPSINYAWLYISGTMACFVTLISNFILLYAVVKVISYISSVEHLPPIKRRDNMLYWMENVMLGPT